MPELSASTPTPENILAKQVPNKIVSFANIAQTTHLEQPGNANASTASRAARRYDRPKRNNMRVLVRLKHDSDFFDKALQI